MEPAQVNRSGGAQNTAVNAQLVNFVKIHKTRQRQQGVRFCNAAANSIYGGEGNLSGVFFNQKLLN